MVHVHLYLLALQSGEKVKIRADIVTDKGTADEWVNYDPEQHGPIMFGNSFRPNPSSSHYFTKKNGDPVFLKAAVKLPASLNLRIGLRDFSDFGEHEIYEKALRTDLNPGKQGSSHPWSGDVPKPTQSDKFRCNFWRKVLQENRSEPVDNVLIDLAHKSASVSEQENSRENITNKAPQQETIGNELHQSVNKENLETASPSVFHFTEEQKLEEALDGGDVDEVKKYCELKEGDRPSRLASSYSSFKERLVVLKTDSEAAQENPIQKGPSI